MKSRRSIHNYLTRIFLRPSTGQCTENDQTYCISPWRGNNVRNVNSDIDARMTVLSLRWCVDVGENWRKESHNARQRPHRNFIHLISCASFGYLCWSKGVEVQVKVTVGIIYHLRNSINDIYCYGSTMKRPFVTIISVLDSDPNSECMPWIWLFFNTTQILDSVSS